MLAGLVVVKVVAGEFKGQNFQVSVLVRRTRTNTHSPTRRSDSEAPGLRQRFKRSGIGLRRRKCTPRSGDALLSLLTWEEGWQKKLYSEAAF